MLWPLQLRGDGGQDRLLTIGSVDPLEHGVVTEPRELSSDQPAPDHHQGRHHKGSIQPQSDAMAKQQRSSSSRLMVPIC